MPLSPAQREQRRLAALERWSREDPGPNMARARAGLDARWLREIEAEAGGPLSVQETTRRLECKR
jgi:hypothetical protein